MRLVTPTSRREFLHSSLVLAAAAGLSGLGAAETPASDPYGLAGTSVSWPSFRNGFDLLGVSRSTLPDKLEVLWKFEAEEQVTSTAAIVEGRVYLASLKGELHCLDLRTGKPVWKYRSIESADAEMFAPGFKASPTITPDKVFIGDEEGVLHAIDRKTGKRLWDFKTNAEIVSGVTLYEDKLLFGSHDNSLYCLKQVDGTKVWSFETQGPVNCTPAISGQRTFVTGCDEHLRVINIESGKEEADLPLGTYLIASPAVVGNMLYVGTYASEVVAIDWKAQKTVWTYKAEDRDFPYHSSAAVTDDVVIVGGRDKRLHCIDRKTGKARWTLLTKAKVDSCPVICGSRVFVGSQDGLLYCADLATGRELWKFPTGKGISASPAIGEGCLVVGNESTDGTVYCFGAK